MTPSDVASCPVCGRLYKADAIERHVNACLALCERAGDQAQPAAGHAAQTSVLKYVASHSQSTPAREEKAVAGVGKTWQQASRLPEYKRVKGTDFIVDGFACGHQAWCTGWFLTHFHSDHYQGLDRSFKGTVYCSRVTGNLVLHRLRIPDCQVICLDIGAEYLIDGVRVTALDANHCPGSAMFIFQTAAMQSILHTGDCRAGSRFFDLNGNILSSLPFDHVYLDTTYCDPKYVFPEQELAIEQLLSAVKTLTDSDKQRLSPLKRLFVVGTYLIGKERIALALSALLSTSIYADRAKASVASSLEWPELSCVLTSNIGSTNLHLAPLGQITREGLAGLFDSIGGYDQIVGIKATGWTFQSGRCESIKVRKYDHRPTAAGGRHSDALVIIDVAYSEHSSFAELCTLLDKLSFASVIPTVDNCQGACLERRMFGSTEQLLLAWASNKPM